LSVTASIYSIHDYQIEVSLSISQIIITSFSF